MQLLHDMPHPHAWRKHQFHGYVEQCLHQEIQVVNAQSQPSYLTPSKSSFHHYLTLYGLAFRIFILLCSMGISLYHCPCTRWLPAGSSLSLDRVHNFIKLAPPRLFREWCIWAMFRWWNDKIYVFSSQKVGLKDKTSDGEEIFKCNRV